MAKPLAQRYTNIPLVLKSFNSTSISINSGEIRELDFQKFIDVDLDFLMMNLFRRFAGRHDHLFQYVNHDHFDTHGWTIEPVARNRPVGFKVPQLEIDINKFPEI